MKAAKYDISVYRNADFTEQWTIQDSNGTAINLTGFSAELAIKKSAEVSEKLLSLTSGSGITLGGVAGTIAISITDAQINSLKPKNLTYYFTLTSGSVTTRWIEGTFEVKS